MPLQSSAKERANLAREAFRIAPGSPAAKPGLPVTKIAIRNLDFFYAEVQALKGVCLDMPQNQITCLIGPSGCGKSTLLRVLNRMYDLYPDQRAAGQVRLDGQDILAPSVDVNLLRLRIGMVFQKPTPFPMSVRDNISLGIRMFEALSRADLDSRVEESLTRASLWGEVRDRLAQPAEGLSVGQQQRLCIARTLATRPEMILFDEPTSALDPISMAKIEELMCALKHDITICLVTHNMEQAARCADQVAFMYLGEMLEAGPCAQMFQAPQQVHTQNYITGRVG